MMASDTSEQSSSPETEVGEGIAALAQLGRAGRRSRRDRPASPPNEPEPDQATAHSDQVSAQSDQSQGDDGPPAQVPARDDDEGLPEPAAAEKAPAKKKSTKKAPARKKETKKNALRSYRLRVPVELAREVDTMIDARNMAYSYAIRLAFARHHEQLTAAVTSDDAELLKAAGMEPPTATLQGETETAVYTISKSAREVLVEEAARSSSS